ncbi:MAG: DUF3795 domain-containing protein [Anaerolineae bacterium]|jgi:hypothetical protein
MATPEELRRYIAPCGLVCYSCPAFTGGPVAQHSRGLIRWLQGFGPMAAAFSSWDTALAEYPAFERVLTHLAEWGCAGCHDGGCPMPDCPVGPCAAERGLDWCWQCDDFPCERVASSGAFGEHLREAWLRANQRMAAVGVDAYWQEQRERPHYGG